MNGSVHLDKRTNKYSIKLHLNRQQICICTDKRTKLPFTSKNNALKALGIIQHEIDSGTFNRDDWRKGQPNIVKTVAWYATKWLKQRQERVLQKSLVARTVSDDKTNLNLYILPKLGNREIGSLVARDIVEFRSGIDREPSGASNVLGTLLKILHEAADEGFVIKVPKFPSMAKRSTQAKRYLSPDKQDRILTAIPKLDRGIFALMVEYGVRPGEARGLMKSSISEDELTIENTFSVNQLRNTTKTGVFRVYPITSYFRKVLADLPVNNSEFVFVRSKDGKPYTSKDLNAIWHKGCSDAGVGKFKLYNGVRHSKARNMLEAGLSFDMVAEVLGHASIDMTRRFYADMPLSRIGAALESLREK